MSLLVTAIAGAWQTSLRAAPGRALRPGRVDRFDKTTGCGLCIRSHTTKESPLQTLKNPPRKDERASDDSAVAKVVDEIISAVAADGDAAVARYSAQPRPAGSRSASGSTPDEIAASLERVPTQVLDDIVFCQEQVRTFAQAQRATMIDLEVETLPGVRLGHRHLPVGERRRLRPRRPLPDGRLRAHEHRHRQGRGRRACRGVHAAARRADPGRHRRRDAPRRRRRDLHPRRRSGDRRAGARDGDDRPGGLPRRPGQRLRRRGQAPAVRQGRHRPHRRPDGDPDRRRRDRRPGDRRRRPARPGRARARLAGCPHHDVAGARRGDAAPGRGAARGPGDRGHRGPRVGGLRRGRRRRLGSTRRSSSPTSTPSSTSRSTPPNPRWYLERMRNYGALFLGEATTVAYGDKTIGTNHILPTRGAARYTGGLWVGKFLKTVTFQECDEEASVMIGEICARQCRIENFEGHARSCDVRVDKYRDAVLARRGDRVTYRLGVDVGGTFTDVVLYDSDAQRVWLAKTPSTPARPVRRRDRRASASSPTARASACPTSTRSSTARPSPRTPSSSAAERSVGLIVTKGFRHILHLAEAWTPGPLFGFMVYEKPEPLTDTRYVREVPERTGADGVDRRADRRGRRPRRRRGARGRRRRGADRLPAQRPRQRAPRAGDRRDRRVRRARPAALDLVRDPPRVPRVRAHRDDADERVRRTGAREVPDERPRRARGCAGAGADPGRALRRRADEPRGGVQEPGPDGAVGPCRRCQRRVVRRRPTRASTASSPSTWAGPRPTSPSASPGRPEITRETNVGDFPVRAPAVDVASIGAGGGSIAYVAEATGALRVGPESAGAAPRPCLLRPRRDGARP